MSAGTPCPAAQNGPRTAPGSCQGRSAGYSEFMALRKVSKTTVSFVENVEGLPITAYVAEDRKTLFLSAGHEHYRSLSHPDTITTRLSRCSRTMFTDDICIRSRPTLRQLEVLRGSSWTCLNMALETSQAPQSSLHTFNQFVINLK